MPLTGFSDDEPSGEHDAPEPERAGRKSPASTDGWLGALQRTSRIGTDPHRILPTVIQEGAETYADTVALISLRETFTHRTLAERQNQYARWALGQDLGKGATVCLLMPNRPEYLAIWLGLSQVGVVVALLNTNLRGAALAHCIDTAKPRSVIVAAELQSAYESAVGHLSCLPVLWMHGAGTAHPRVDSAIDGLSGARLTLEEGARPRLSDRALLIYTSGTTGLPKAAHVSHHRLMMWSHWFAGLMNTAPADRMYNCLPLYHSIGGVVATGSVLVSGGAVVIREKFSASAFWRDIVQHDCTLFQYIGELCRYLVNAPHSPFETSHRLRICTGNGLRADVWTAFQDRFKVPRILEFYAATEGTVSLYNVEGQVGAVGRVPPFLGHRSPAAIVRHDVDTGTPWRDGAGLCRRTPMGETGELIGRLADDPAQAAQRFEGYTSAADTAGKVLRDVFKPGDAWLRTGDLMRQDAKGFFTFVDRVGDTFRWKGENVATTEVAAAAGTAAHVREAAVYGVKVPGTEGRAGMAAMVVGPGFDLAAFRADLATRLPTYARPLFLRLRDGLDVTETFKQKKAALADEGFDPTRTRDALYVDDPVRGAYVRIVPATHDAIMSGAMRL